MSCGSACCSLSTGSFCAFCPGCPVGDGVHVNEMNVFTWSMDPASGGEAGMATGGIIGMVAILAALVLGLVLLVFMFLEGTRGPNQYGADPKGTDANQVFA